MGAILEAYITNLGKYNEGQLVGETLKFPTTTEEVQSLLKRIGVDGVRYEEIFITSFDSDVLGLHEHLGEYENIDELNYLAALLSDMDQSDLEKFEAVIDAGEYTGSVKDLINLTQNLDCFEFYSGIHSEEDLGRMYILDFEAMAVPEHLIDYIDYEAYGRDIRINDGGHFAPPVGMWPITTAASWSFIRAGMIFPTNTGYSPCPGCPSGSRWPHLRKL